MTVTGPVGSTPDHVPAPEPIRPAHPLVSVLSPAMANSPLGPRADDPRGEGHRQGGIRSVAPRPPRQSWEDDAPPARRLTLPDTRAWGAPTGSCRASGGTDRAPSSNARPPPERGRYPPRPEASFTSTLTDPTDRSPLFGPPLSEEAAYPFRPRSRCCRAGPLRFRSQGRPGTFVRPPSLLPAAPPSAIIGESTPAQAHVLPSRRTTPSTEVTGDSRPQAWNHTVTLPDVTMGPVQVISWLNRPTAPATVPLAGRGGPARPRLPAPGFRTRYAQALRLHHLPGDAVLQQPLHVNSQGIVLHQMLIGQPAEPGQPGLAGLE